MTKTKDLSKFTVNAKISRYMMEDVIKVFYFLFFYFFLQSIYKGIESLHKLKYSNL